MHRHVRQPQLRMVRELADLPELVTPEGTEVRRFSPGDEARWVQLLAANGELGHWDMDRAERAFSGPQRVWREGIHFLMREEEAAATACVQPHDATPDVPELGWVAVHPNHRGRRFGPMISLAVMHFMRGQGYERCILRTDDQRLPAIKVYLRLGFEPDLESHESYPKRWDAVQEGLISDQRS